MQLSIIGMGLIGTSVGMAITAASLEKPQSSPLGAVEVVGYDTHPSAVKTAHRRRAIAHIAPTLEAAVEQADVVMIATPVRTISPILSYIAPHLRAGAIVTDVASTKTDVCQWGQELLPESVDFIGGHPMAGREQAGAEAADPDLFNGAIYCLTPPATARQHALATTEALVKALGAIPYYIDPEEHDSFVAGISHLPFVLSTALVEVTTQSVVWREMARLAATGYRDVTRLASGDVAMHRDICLTNRAALIHWIDEFQQCLGEVRDALKDNDNEAIELFFANAKQQRDAWLAQYSPHDTPEA
jgi:prephenate dehydrogenase